MSPGSMALHVAVLALLQALHESTNEPKEEVEEDIVNEAWAMEKVETTDYKRGARFKKLFFLLAGTKVGQLP
jgi:hypothetical protein